MKKLVVAALVLGLAGIAAAGAIHVSRSICDGVCPMTGRPVAHRSSAPSAAVSTGSNIECYGEAPENRCDAAAAESSPDAGTECSQRRRHCCGAKQEECCEEAQKIEKQPETPSSKP